MNNKGFAITTILYGTLILFLMLLVSMLGILSTYKERLSKLIDGNNGARCIINGNCSDSEEVSSPNHPDVDDGMIPVIISDEGEVTTISSADPSWYDYDNQKWANVILVDENARSDYVNTTGVEVNQDDIMAYYVWIPRYRYSFPNADGKPEEISVIFESSNHSKSYGTAKGNSYRTHPAFTFGDNELSGIWVGKFETTGTTSMPTILPNKTPLIAGSISAYFTTSLIFSYGKLNDDGSVAFGGSSGYGLTANVDSHMMKNSEWGAVAYLSHSKYGMNEEIGINDYYGDDENTKTGCGYSEDYTICGDEYGTVSIYPQSTTGNITGVFDMAGGREEYVMANYNNMMGDSGFSFMPEGKYYDLYTTLDLSTACNDGICYGHALSETREWDYNPYDSFSPGDKMVWYMRGGAASSDSGLFYIAVCYGNADPYAWRSVLVVK